ncbi:AraC family transcriptional regulator [Verrucomicrobia bacterium LW23]|nr:AraC family transcriptional regulator [Verrucomicrobia bacterium LW23]
MRIPPGATSFVGAPATLSPGEFRERRLRHTFRLHGSQDWLLILTLGGGGLYRCGPEAAAVEHVTCANEVTLFRPGVFQDYRIAPASGRWDLLYAHFLPRADWLPWLAWPEVAPGSVMLLALPPEESRRAAALLRETIRHAQGTAPRRIPLAQNALERLVLVCDSANPRQAALRPDARILRAADHLGTRLAAPFDAEELSRAAGLSPSRLRHLFRSQMGVAPQAYHEGLRIRRARELLAMSRQTVGEIAAELGFDTPFYFSLRFKKHTGESPRAFRQRMISGG